MAAHKAPVTTTRTKTRYELWQETIDGALKDARWSEYDCDIQRAVTQYNRHLRNTPGYMSLDWRLIKAMVWTESGGPNNRAWRNNPIQIGNPGDPGLRALLSDKEGGPLIIPPELKDKLSIASALATPQMNIRAGIAYLLMRLAQYSVGTVPDQNDTKTYEAVVKAGDSLDRIARAGGTTVDTIRRLNSGTAVLRPGQVLKYEKAAVQKIIVMWNMATPLTIATRYNIGDPDYARKLEYCLAVMRKSKLTESACAS